MVIILECDTRFNKTPGIFKSRVMTRAWWLWFAVSLLHIPLDEFGAISFEWRVSSMTQPVLVGLCLGCWEVCPEGSVVEPYPGKGIQCLSDDCNHIYSKRRMWRDGDNYFFSKQDLLNYNVEERVQ